MNEIVVKEIKLSNEKSVICEEVLRDLPDWFGIEQAILNYIKDVQKMPMLAAFRNNKLVGFASINLHNKSTGEIHVMGVLPICHRSGIGTVLVNACRDYLFRRNFHFLTVKTLGPSRESPSYQKTREFYERMGFHPIEEFENLWGNSNPCLLMAMAIQDVPGKTELVVL